MATLTNTKIKDTYDGLLKTTTNEAIAASGVTLIEDGLGNASALSVGRSGNGVTITGNLAVDTNTLYVDASSNRVGVGTSSPEAVLHVVANTTTNQFILERTGTQTGKFKILTINDALTIRNEALATDNFLITSTGVVDIKSSGTAAEPSLRLGGDADTGWYRPTSNTIAFTTAGSESMRIDSSGRVGIGETLPDTKLHVNSGGTNDVATFESTDSFANVIIKDNGGEMQISKVGTDVLIYTENSATHGNLRFLSNSSTERMRIDSSGNVGIGTASPFRNLDVQGSIPNIRVKSTGAGESASISIHALGSNGSSSAETEITAIAEGSGSAASMAFTTREGGGARTEKMRIDSSGNVGIGGSPITKLTLEGVRNTNTLTLRSTSNDSGWSSGDEFGAIEFYSNDQSGGGVGVKSAISCVTTSSSGANSELVFSTSSTGTNNVERMRITSVGDVQINALAKLYFDGGANTYIHEKAGDQLALVSGGGEKLATSGSGVSITGNLSVSGSLSKGSGSFKIDHPLEEKKDTHHLVHSFVESPQANNIYRGKIQLVDGKATINLDEVSAMSEGTFILLNRDIHTYTSNESDWDAVRGSVEGNILTIECQNTDSTAIVSWLVIGERQDQHMYDTDWTDENGKVIVEPLKQIEE